MKERMLRAALLYARRTSAGRVKKFCNFVLKIRAVFLIRSLPPTAVPDAISGPAN
jgi:hypothetical protein